MAVFNLRLYAANPTGIFSQTAGGRAVWTGPPVANGTAVVTDNAPGANGLVLADEYTGETATADVTVGSFSATNANVESEESWLLRDIVTGETIRVVQFNVNEGGAQFTLTSAPLVQGRIYETQSFVGGVEPASGFTYADFNDGTVSGTAGDDVIDRNYTGDPNGDRVDAADQYSSATQQTFSWNTFADEQNLAGGATQTQGGVQVAVSSTLSPGGTFSAETGETVYVPVNSGFNPTSSGYISADGNSATSTIRFDFSSTTAGISPEVHNVDFVINDIDSVVGGNQNFQDILTIRAFDVDGNPVAVTLTALGNDSISGSTISGTRTSDTPGSVNGAVRVYIAGPVARFEIDYRNGGNTFQFVQVSDIHFDAVSSVGDADSIDAGAGNDSVFAGSADDTVSGGTGNDTIDGGSGNDLLNGDGGNDSILGGSGNDTLDGGNGNDTLLGGTGNDVLRGGNNNDSLDGGDGNDTLFGDAGNDILRGGNGADSLDGGAGSDTLFGGAGNDTLFGGADNSADTLNGEDGNDSLDGGGGNDSLDGGAGDDTLIGGAGNDTLIDGAGNDSLSGGTGDDSLVATGGGSDTLRGEDGNDVLRFTGTSGVLDGGAGDDTIFAQGTSNSVSGGDGADDISGGAGTETVDGGAGDDIIRTSGGADRLSGGADRDTFRITAGFGADTIAGGETGTDFDTLDFSALAGPVTVTASGTEGGTATDGTDTLSFSEIERFILTGSNDILTGGSGAQTILAGAGNDTIDGAAGDDSILGEGGNDVILDGAGNDTVDGGAGNDTIGTSVGGGSAGNDLLIGGAGNDSIFFSNGSDTVQGGDDADFIYGLGSDQGSVIEGGEGGTDRDTLSWAGETDAADAANVTYTSTEAGTAVLRGQTTTFSQIETIQTTQANDTVNGTAATGGIDVQTLGGNDSIRGGSGNDTLDGGTGNDTIAGGAGNDRILGGDGADSVVFANGFGNDTIIGGEGGTDNDVLDFSAVTGPVSVNYTGVEAGTVNDGTPTSTATFSEVERLILTNQNDTVDGRLDTAGLNIDARGGNDRVLGGSGRDTLLGGAGNDFLDGGTAGDSISGGDGADTIALSDNFGSDTITGGEGGTDADVIDLSGLTGAATVTATGNEAATITSGGSTANASEIERFILTGQNDLYNGAANGAAVTVDAGAGNDTINAGAGNDVLNGEAGNDSISGGAGNDTITGGSGNDTLNGGTGNDSLDGGTGTDRFILGNTSGTDTIVGGENAGDRDLLDFGGAQGGNGVNVTFTGAEAGGYTVGAATGTFSEIEDVAGTNNADLIDARLSSGNHNLSGGAGADTIYGGSGNDTLSGGDDADTFRVADGFGNDVIIGGEGGDDNDVIDLSGLSGPVTVTYTGDEAGTITDGTSTITFSNIERLILTDRADVVDARLDTSGVNIDAGGGDDTVVGGTGADTLLGGAGDDELTGGAGADSVVGGAGNDTLNVGSGDTATGGDGDDTFAVDPAALGGGTITVIGGEGAEGAGDTITLGGTSTPGGLTISNPDDDAGGISGTFVLQDGTNVAFSEIETVICFLAGTRIATPQGPRAVETLRAGDLILTVDDGPQPLQWIGARHGLTNGDTAPVVFAPGTIGNERALCVSPQHRMLLRGWRAQLYFGEEEVLVPAKALIDGAGIRSAPVGEALYYHLLTPRHGILYAEGAMTETFLPAAFGLAGVRELDRARLFAVRPDLRADLAAYGAAARPMPQARQARLLAG